MIVSERSFEMLEQSIGELCEINAKPVLNKRDEQRQVALLAIISAIKAGTAPSQIRNWEKEKLLKAANLPRPPHRARTRLDEDDSQEWRRFAIGEQVRPTHIPKDGETRAYLGELAGAQSVSFTQPTAGGAFTHARMYENLYATKKKYDSIFDEEFCNVIETVDGNVTQVPIWDDVANAAVQVTEATASNEVDISSLSQPQLHAWSFRTKIVPMSLELAQDANWPVGDVLELIFALRLARGCGAAMINGSGVNAPTGLLTGAIASGATVIVASGSSSNTGGSETGATTIGSVDLGKLYQALDPAYRDRTAAFYMNDSTLNYLRQLLDKQGRPLIELGRDGLTGQADVPYLLGRRVAICPSMPSMASGHNSVVFANPLYIAQRRVPSSVYVRRFWESVGLVEAGLIGFEMWERLDSTLVSGNSSFVPAAVLQNHS